jgi:hypothetical protein
MSSLNNEVMCIETFFEKEFRTKRPPIDRIVRLFFFCEGSEVFDAFKLVEGLEIIDECCASKRKESIRLGR